MRVESQVQSLHYFHTYAAKNRCGSAHTCMDDTKAIGEILSLPKSTFLPTTDDCMTVRNNFVILTSCIIVKYLPSFSGFKQCVSQHLPYQYSHAMSKKTQTVSAVSI